MAPRTISTTVALLLALALWFAIAPAAQASFGVQGFLGGGTGSLANQLSTPQGDAVNQTGNGGVPAGTLYVAESGNNRVSVFDSAGNFVRTWGEDVVSTGQDQSNMIQRVTVDATAGNFTLKFGANTTSEIPATATAAEVQTALNALASINTGGGSVAVSGGPGSAGGTTPYLVTFNGGPLAGNNQALMTGANGTTPLSGGAATITVLTVDFGGNGFEICNANPPSNDVCKAGLNGSATRGALASPLGVAIDQATGNVYVSSQTFRRIDEYSAKGSFIRSFGNNVVASGPSNVTATSAVQTLTITATGGKYKLKFGGKETAELAYNATAAEIQTALTGLTSIGAGNATVSETGAGVFKITFAGALANNPEPLITTESGPGEVLTGGTATVANTTTGASGFEICGSSNGDICQAGTTAEIGGALATTFNGQLAIAPTGSPNVGDVIVADPGNRRVQEFTSGGAFVRAFGFDVVKAGPDSTGTSFEECKASAGDACKVGTTGSGLGQFGTGTPTRVAEDSTGAIYTVEPLINFRVQKFTPQVGPPSLSPAVFGIAGAPNGTAANNTPTDVSIGSAGQVFVTKAFTAGSPVCPNGLAAGAERRVLELTANGLTLSDTHMLCGTINVANGLDATSAGGPIYVSSTTGASRVYKLGNVTPPAATINAPSPLTQTGATITGTINPNGSLGVPNPTKTAYHLEYKLVTEGSYTTYAPDVNVGSGTSPVPVSVTLGELQPNKEYSARFVATKEFGGGVGIATETFTTEPAPPTIVSFSATNVTASTADLHATINPLGKESSYRFEYGTSQEYGSLAPIPNEAIGSGYGPVNVTVHLTGLSDTPYHFRVFAENSLAQTSVSEDSTFSFSPPTGCPNDRVRQQTGAAYLPDCRGYELVSAGQAGGAALNPLGPLSGYASNPGRFTYGALLNAIPGAGEPINDGFEGDMYVASRTTSGWKSQYVGIPGYQSVAESGPPGEEYAGNILMDKGMSRFVIWDRAQRAPIAGGPLQGTFAPDVFDNEGNFVEQLPTNLAEVPESLTDMTEGGFRGSVAITPTLSHYVFSSIKTAFTPEGITATPGSAYDDEVSSNTVTLVSKTAANLDIPPGSQAGEFIRIPAVSDDGSHILMSTAGSEEGTTHLYMRVNHAVTYDISRNVALVNVGVKFENMTSDGSKVFFTTSQKMTADDEDTSVDLYMWSEGTNSLTRISTGAGAGNTDSCVPASNWTQKCNVEVVPNPNLNEPTGGRHYGKQVDSSMATETGEIYFYSPEVLEAGRGIPNKRNLYVYREGTAHHVATLEPSGQATRIQVTPDGAHMAFISTTKLTPYNNAGKAEMYRYDPVARTIQCVSCLPSGEPPTVSIAGSQKGLFLTLDGRTFFSTKDALVPQDANGIVDIYEFVSGRPQLISTGTGDTAGSPFQPIGLVGVSADGVDVFFSTYQTIVPEDENGEQLKFYDARSNGGFPFNVPPAPCAAADECHGNGSSAPAAPQTGTGATLGSGGNFPKAHRCPKGKRRHNGKCHRKRARHTKQGSGRHG